MAVGTYTMVEYRVDHELFVIAAGNFDGGQCRGVQVKRERAELGDMEFERATMDEVLARVDVVVVAS